MSAFVYSPYGCIGEQTPQATLIGFNGNRYDPRTGAYALGQGYRSYNPALMRFYSPDDLSPFGKGGYNAYAYCACDPINFRDDSGRNRKFTGLQRLWEERSRQPAQQAAPRKIKPAALVKAPPALNTSRPAPRDGPSKKTVEFNQETKIHSYPKEQIANKEFLRTEKNSLAIYIVELHKRVQRKQRMLDELNDPSTLDFALSKGFDEKRYNIAKLELAVWLDEARSRIRNLNGTLRAYG